MKNPNVKKTDDTRPQLDRFVSPDNADVNVLSSSFLKCLTVDSFGEFVSDFDSFQRFTFDSFFDRSNSERKWQALSAHQSESEVLEYIFASATDENDMTIIGGMTESLEYIFTLNIEEIAPVYVRTINGKTISIKWDRQQKTARILETVESKTSIPRDMMYLVS